MLLFSSNAAGDFCCKLLVFYHLQNPHSLKDNKAQLPVFLRANKKLWMTAAIFEDWFWNCFVWEVKT